MSTVITSEDSKIQHLIELNSLQTSKIYQLEEDNSNYDNKFKILNSEIEELKFQLDSVINENISLQNENNLIRVEAETEIIRLSMELEETKNENINLSKKEKKILKINMENNKGNHNDKNTMANRDEILKPHNSLNSLNSIFKKQPSEFLTFLTPVTKNKKIPEKFLQNYSKSFLNFKPGSFTGINNININTLNTHTEKEKEKFSYLFSKEKFIINSVAEKTKNLNVDDTGSFIYTNNLNLKRGDCIYSDDKNKNPVDPDEFDDEEEMEFIKQKIENEIQQILENRKIFILNTLTHENFSFDIIEGNRNRLLKINQTEFKINSDHSENKNIHEKLNKKVIQNMNEILQKVQSRKNKIMIEKKHLQNQLERVGINIV